MLEDLNQYGKKPKPKKSKIALSFFCPNCSVRKPFAEQRLFNGMLLCGSCLDLLNNSPIFATASIKDSVIDTIFAEIFSDEDDDQQ